MNTSEIQQYMDEKPALVTHPLLVSLFEQAASLLMAQEQAQNAMRGTTDVEAIQVYGEFLYLTHYPVYPGNLGDLRIYEVNKTVKMVKDLALAQWLHFFPDGYAGEIWLH